MSDALASTEAMGATITSLPHQRPVAGLSAGRNEALSQGGRVAGDPPLAGVGVSFCAFDSFVAPRDLAPSRRLDCLQVVNASTARQNERQLVHERIQCDLSKHGTR